MFFDFIGVCFRVGLVFKEEQGFVDEGDFSFDLLYCSGGVDFLFIAQ